MTEKELKFELQKKDKQIQELYVLIDTMQTNLRSVSSYLNEEQKNTTSTHTFKWCMGWKAGDEKK